MPKVKDNAHQGPTVLWLLDLIEEFLTINEMDNDGERLGGIVFNDRTLVCRLRNGADLYVTRMDDLLAFMKNPDRSIRVETGEGTVLKPLKPLNIKPRSIP